MNKRIFDIIEQRSLHAPNAIMLAAKEYGQWRTYSCREVWETANSLANGLLSIGISNEDLVPEKQEKIAIISPNRPEWMITDIAVQLTGAVLTPIYPTISPTELSYILEQASVKTIFIADEQIFARFKEVLYSNSNLKNIYTFNQIEGISHWKTLVEKNPNSSNCDTTKIKEETLATIIYTSGTTGEPKGVMLTHKNIVSNINDSMPAFTFVVENGRALSFLPLNHIFERTVSYIYLQAGVSIYYAENMDTIGLNLKEVKPIVFTTVPRLLEKVYERILNTGMNLKGIKKMMFFWALALGKQYDNIDKGNLFYQIQLWFANLIIFNKWREALGGNVKAIVVGSAAAQERLVRIFSAANIVIMEGYGLTETSPVVSVNRFESENRRIGTIGPLIDNVEVKLADDGEILVRGNNITIGYYKNKEQTDAAIKDGWLYTGDIGAWVDTKFLKITDRKKEIFKTSGGKYVAPAALENKMKESLYIEQMLVIGSGRKFVSALVVPSFIHLRKHFRDNQPTLIIPDNNSQLIKMPEIQEFMQKQIDKYNVFFAHPEQIKKIALLPDEWTIDNNELTPSLKMKRKVIEQKFASQIAEIYQSDELN